MTMIHCCKGVKHGLKWYEMATKYTKLLGGMFRTMKTITLTLMMMMMVEIDLVEIYILGYNCAQVNAPTPVQCVSAISPSVINKHKSIVHQYS